MFDGTIILFACMRFSLLVAHGAASTLQKHAGEHPHYAAPSDLQGLFQAWIETNTGPSKNSTTMPNQLSRAKAATSVWEAYDINEWQSDQPKFSNLVKFSQLPVDDNLCMSGKLVPELYVIGVVKSATTSLSNDLRRSPAIIWPYHPYWEYTPGFNDFVTGNTVKESHFLDQYVFLGKDFMLESYPSCRVDARVTAVEASPRYFMDPTVPSKLSQWYGETLRPRIKFVILLRNPVDRFFSDFYHAKADHWCLQYDNRTFNDILDDIVTGGAMKYKGGELGCKDRLEASLYKTSLTRWWTTFPANQFTIIPWLYQIKPGTQGRSPEPVVEKIWAMFNLQRGPVSFNTLKNVHDHPPIEQEAAPEKLKAFTEFIANESSVATLANLFVSYSGVHLYEYKGQLGDESATANWISNNW